MKWGIIFLGFLIVFYWLYRDIFLSNQEEKTLWIVDNSLSMVVQDIQSNSDILLSRLDLAGSLVLSWRALIPGEHALMTLWDGAKLLLPFSDESDIFSATVQWIVPVLYDSQTDIQAALSAVELIYGNSPMHIILLSDGEDTSANATMNKEIISSSKQYTFIAIGTIAWWPMLQGYDAQWNPRYKYFEWKTAISRLDMNNVERISEKYNATSYVIDSIKTLDKDILQNIQKKNKEISYLFQSQWIYLSWILLLLIWLMLPSVIYKK
jgi:hypothetical protein